ncbi:MAG TPA: ATP-binding protein [Flavisolibacter sp.]|nr:ATP-binding protein [Flavisolibacter sp.]
MEAVIFCGIQGSGKTTFYKERFFKTHVRISLDQLHTRNKEHQFLQTCFLTSQRFVVDNTNPTIAERIQYIQAAKQAKFKVLCYYFETDVTLAIERNKNRHGKECIPIAGIKGTFKKLQVPSYIEGFDQLYTVRIEEGGFVVWQQLNPDIEVNAANSRERK